MGLIGRGEGVSRSNGRDVRDSLRADELLTADDLAKRWQVPKSHVYRLTREGKLPAVKLGKYSRYRADAIEAFERGGGTADPSPTRGR